jgi:hypothetical protein
MRNQNPAIAAEAYDWQDRVSLNSMGVYVTLIPSQHWSARSLFDRNMSLWASFVIETPTARIYFVADSGYGDGQYFRSARERHGPFDRRPTHGLIRGTQQGWHLARSLSRITAWTGVGAVAVLSSHQELGGAPSGAWLLLILEVIYDRDEHFAKLGNLLPTQACDRNLINFDGQRDQFCFKGVTCTRQGNIDIFAIARLLFANDVAELLHCCHGRECRGSHNAGQLT